MHQSNFFVAVKHRTAHLHDRWWYADILYVVTFMKLMSTAVRNKLLLLYINVVVALTGFACGYDRVCGG